LKEITISNGPRLTVLAFSLLAMIGCAGESQDGPDSANQGEVPAAAQPMSGEVQDLVNRGNEAQRSGDYQGAMELYQEAMAMAPDHPVPQFGGLMAAMAMGDQALTDSLSAILQETSPELLAMLNPDGSMGGGMPANPHAGGMPGSAPPMEGLPEGHPSLNEAEPGDTATADTTGMR